MAAKRLSRYLPLIIWMAFISFASTSGFSAGNTSRIIRPLVLWLFPATSEETLALIHFTVRKVAHFVEYAILGILAARTFTSSSRPLIKRFWFSLSLFLVTLYALFDELHQSFEPSRTGSIYDCLIDTLGGLSALLLCKRWRRAGAL